jgi:hypothetical protein
VEFEQLMKFVIIFFVVWTVMAVIGTVIVIIGMRKAEKIFAEVNLGKIKYREKYASGYSKKSIITRLGGASYVLDVLVTDQHVCVKGIFSLFTYIGTKFDLAHCIKKELISNISMDGFKVTVTFRSPTGSLKEIVLILQHPSLFVAAVNG